MSLFLPNSILNILQNVSIREEDLLNNLPPEIIIEILSRLPAVTILRCKRVCKSWRDLVERPDFATSHLSKPISSSSTSCIAINQCWRSYKIFRFVGEQIAAESLLVSSCWPCPNKPILYSSANGLLFLLEKSSLSDILFICNPITREYIELHLPHPRGGRLPLPDTRVFGFGVTNISGKNKIVRIIFSSKTGFPSMCQVYTLGTGHWRSIAIAACSRLLNYKYNPAPAGVFLNGNLHWLLYDSHGNPCVSCLDLETELFTSFSPPLDFPHDSNIHPSLSALGDRLCFYTNTRTVSHADGLLLIWLMKDYGDEKSWTKEFIIKKLPHCTYSHWHVYGIYPLNVLEDGDILFVRRDSGDILRYSIETKAMRLYAIIKQCHFPFDNVVSYTPSFVSLKTLEMENVVSL